MLKLIISLLCILYPVGLLADTWSSPGRVIVIGGDYNFPPYEFIDKEGNPAGYNVDLTRAIAEVMAIEIKIVLGGWDDMRAAFVRGEIDVLQGMTVTRARQNLVTYSPPHAIVQQSIFARKGEAKISSLDDLSNKSVIVQNQGSMHDFLKQAHLDAEIVPVTAHVDALRLLSSGKHDYAIVANLPGLYLGKELGLTNLTVVGKPFEARGYAYAVKKGDEPLLAQFSEGFAILQNTGRQQEIYDKWLGLLEQKPGLDWKKFGVITFLTSVVMLLAMGAIMMWNRTLKLQVDKRTTELHMQQQQLIQADKMASLGVLVSGVAHEINNPTGLLLLNLPVVNDVWKDSQDVLEVHYQQHGDFDLGGLQYSRMREEVPCLLSEMQDGARRIKRIVEDLKDFARHENDDVSELVSLNEIAATAIRLVENSIRKSTDHFSVKYTNYLPLVNASSQRIEQVIINLILNACQALLSRERSVSLVTGYDHETGLVFLSVSDEGEGVDEQNMHRLTDPFFTTKREQGGTGLGLSVSAGIVKAYRGKLEFSSIKHKGTTVTMSLPAAGGEK